MANGSDATESTGRGGLPQGIARWFVAPDFYREREVTVADWVQGIFEPFAIVATIVCFVVGVVQCLLAFAPNWSPTLLLPLTALVSLEAFFYARRLARPSLLFKEWAALLLPPLLVLRFAPYLVEPWRLPVDIPIWWSDPASFFSAGFIAGALVLLLAWWAAYVTTHDLNRIRVQPGELRPEGTQALRYGLDAENVRLLDHTTPLRSIASRFLWGGMVLVCLGGVSALGVRQEFTLEAVLQLVSFSRPGQHLALANVILYFAFGFALIGEAQYVRLNTLWRLDRLTPPAHLASRWGGYLVALIVVVLGISLLLPTDYALTVAEVVAVLFSGLGQVLTLVAMLVFFILSIVLWPLRLLGGGGGEEVSTPPPPTPPPMVTTPSEPVAWLEVARSLIFWLVAIGIVAYFTSVLWRERRPLSRFLPMVSAISGVFGWLGRCLAALTRFGRRAVVAVGSTLPRLFARPVAAAASRPRRWLSLRRLGPRDLVAYFYLSIVERATRLGYPKLPGQTAVEYTRLLHERLPDIDPELGELTTAFLQARYGPRSVATEEVSYARARWNILKSKLRRLRGQRNPDGAARGTG